MNPRQEKLIKIVRSHERMSLQDLASQLNVSVQTVRRDVEQLALGGHLLRFHGGVSAGATVENITYQQRQLHNAEGKARIARLVAARIPNDCALMLTVGTTTCAVARELRGHRGLRVVTNDMTIAQLLSGNREIEVHMCGGFVRSRDHAIVGEAAVDFVSHLQVGLNRGRTAAAIFLSLHLRMVNERKVTAWESCLRDMSITAVLLRGV